MGYGDELMVAGEAKRRGGSTSMRFAVPDPRGGRHPTTRWSEVWEGNPRMARPGEPYDAAILNYPGHRPYISGKTDRKWTWRPYAPEPAEVFFFPGRERILQPLAKGMVVINPFIKSLASPNKQWGLHRWQQLIDTAPSINWVQLGGVGSSLRGAALIETRTFREAMATLSGAKAIVTHEGGMHHAAAALNIPAVVLFGGYVSPEVTGYKSQTNLFRDDEHQLGCGFRQQCNHCERAMASFDPTHVLKKLKELL